MSKCTVFGLGSMGYGMAVSALAGGHEVWGVDVDAARMEQFQREGGMAGAVADVLPEVDVVLVVVLNAAQTESVLFGDVGVVPQLRDGAVVIACATVAPEFARDMGQRCAQHGVHYLDAPVSGGSIKAASGQLSIMASGSRASFDAAAPVLESIAETVYELGDAPGAGSAMKAVNQLLAGTHIAAMAEALTFGITQGIEPKQFLEVISNCAGTSWMLENRAPHIVAGDYTPHSQVNIWPKDLGIVLDIAQSANFSAPITAAAMNQYLAAVDMGLGAEDDAAVAKVYARDAGVDLPEKAS